MFVNYHGKKVNKLLMKKGRRPQWPRGLRIGSAAVGFLGLRVRIPPPGAWNSVSCECYVLSGRGLCDGLITHPEESYRMWSWSLDNEEALAHWNCCTMGGWVYVRFHTQRDSFITQKAYICRDSPWLKRLYSKHSLQELKRSNVTYKKNGYPSETYIVKRNCSLERVVWRSFALSVVLVPVDTGLVCCWVDGTRNGTVVTHHALFYVMRKIGALVHAVVFRFGADVVSVLLRVDVVGCQWPADRAQNILTASFYSKCCKSTCRAKLSCPHAHHEGTSMSGSIPPLTFTSKPLCSRGKREESWDNTNNASGFAEERRIWNSCLEPTHDPSAFQFTE